MNMMGGKSPHGFTIIETMLFLAISGVILISAMIFLSGRQNETEFQQGMHQIQSNLQAYVAHVAEGYYANSTNNFTCSGEPTSPTFTITSGSSNEGTDLGCQYLGEAIQFGNDGNAGQYTTYPIIGEQYTDSSLDQPTSLPDVLSLPHAALGYVDSTSPVNDSQSKTLPFGIQVSADGSSSDQNTALLGFYAFNASAAQGPNGSAMSIYGYSGVRLNNATTNTLKNGVAVMNETTPQYTPSPSSGYQICFNSGTTDQDGIITFGANGNPTNVTLTINIKGRCS